MFKFYAVYSEFCAVTRIKLFSFYPPLRLQPECRSRFDRTVYFKIPRIDGGTFPINVSTLHSRRITVLSLVLQTILQRDTVIFIFVALLRSFLTILGY